jgi:hypothetical protein
LEVETPAPGLYENVPENVYRAWRAVSQSALKPLRRSPAHARWEYLNPSSSPTTDLGSAIHCVALEPAALETRFAVRPPGIDGRTKEGKAALAKWRDESAGKIMLEQRDDFETLRGVRDALLDHPTARELLTAPGFTEASALWRFGETACKGRMDRIVEFDGAECVVDLKSCEDASPQGFARTVEKWGYHVQSAFYLDGLDEIEAAERRWLWIAAEKTPPYGVAIYEPDLVWLDYGRAQYRAWLAQWETCSKSGLWPSYPTQCQVIEAPEWVAKRLEVIG